MSTQPTVTNESAVQSDRSYVDPLDLAFMPDEVEENKRALQQKQSNPGQDSPINLQPSDLNLADKLSLANTLIDTDPLKALEIAKEIYLADHSFGGCYHIAAQHYLKQENFATAELMMRIALSKGYKTFEIYSNLANLAAMRADMVEASNLIASARVLASTDDQHQHLQNLTNTLFPQGRSCKKADPFLANISEYYQAISRK